MAFALDAARTAMIVIDMTKGVLLLSSVPHQIPDAPATSHRPSSLPLLSTASLCSSLLGNLSNSPHFFCPARQRQGAGAATKQTREMSPRSSQEA